MQVTTTSSIRDRYRHMDPEWTCCKQRFVGEARYRYHLTAAHPERVYCYLCMLSFEDEDFQGHIDLKHAYQPYSTSDACSECELPHEANSYLCEFHRSSDVSVSCVTCGEHVRKSAYKPHALKHAKEQLLSFSSEFNAAYKSSAFDLQQFQSGVFKFGFYARQAQLEFDMVKTAFSKTPVFGTVPFKKRRCKSCSHTIANEKADQQHSNRCTG